MKTICKHLYIKYKGLFNQTNYLNHILTLKQSIFHTRPFPKAFLQKKVKRGSKRMNEWGPKWWMPGWIESNESELSGNGDVLPSKEAL